MRTAPRVRMRTTGLALFGVLVAALAVLAGTSLSSAQTGQMTGTNMASARVGHIGTTQGWLGGRTVTFAYSKNFKCNEPPSSKAKSHCEVGANYNSIPSHEFDPLYIVTPVGFTPKKSTLQCPKAGSCIDHPHRIDLTRVFGSGTGKSLLPPHSHVVTTDAGNQPEWWNVDVVGVTSQHAWHRIVTHKNYKVIERMRANGNKHLTDNIPSNLFLFFAVEG